MRNGSLLYLISIHKVFDFTRMNLILCIGLHAYALHNIYIHLIICICIFLFAYAFLNFHMHFCICIYAFLPLHMHYYVHMHYMQCHNPIHKQRISDTPEHDFMKNVVNFKVIHMQQISATPKLDLVEKCNNL